MPLKPTQQQVRKAPMSRLTPEQLQRIRESNERMSKSPRERDFETAAIALKALINTVEARRKKK